jgi:UDP-GlcNAc:undecaprenyl-phosphate/decaprenyl-phosphate GlcNAc-1-phosphate transferase
MAYQILGQVSGAPFTADEVLSPYIYVFYIAFIVSFIFTPVMRTVAAYYGIIDQPDQVRKMHREPVAYLGGVAVFLGWMAGLAVSQFLRLHYQELGWPPHLVVKFSIVIGACIIVVVGLWDDVLGVRPAVKIGGQVFAAMFLLVDGVGTYAMRPFLNPVGAMIQARFGVMADPAAPLFPEWFVIATSSIFVVLVVVACCNAANLMDGLDGLCGGVTAIIAGGFLFLAMHLAMFGGGLNTNWDGLRIVIALALLGAVLGFIPYNFNPASIFMGDTGSMFLGFACAVIMILMAQGHPKWFLASMVIFALPVLDTSLAFARRWVNRRPLFSADRYHFHHQLVARGLSVKRTVVISYGLAIGFALLGVAMVYVRTRYAIALYLVTFGSIIVAAYKMGMVHERPQVVTRRRLATADRETQTKVASPQDVIEVRDEAGEEPAEPVGPGLRNT